MEYAHFHKYGTSIYLLFRIFLSLEFITFGGVVRGDDKWECDKGGDKGEGILDKRLQSVTRLVQKYRYLSDILFE